MTPETRALRAARTRYDRAVTRERTAKAAHELAGDDVRDAWHALERAERAVLRAAEGP